MERNIDRKTLGFDKGMTNVPSDLLSDDNELSECVGFIFRNGEMKPIQKPNKMFNISKDEQILYVHKGASFENLITYAKDGYLYWYRMENGVIIDDTSIENEIIRFDNIQIKDITSVNNTLVLSTSQGLCYLLFKNNNYICLGEELPTPNVVFSTNTDLHVFGNRTGAIVGSFIEVGSYIFVDTDSEGNYIGEHIGDNTHYHYFQYKIKSGKTDYDNFQRAIQGHVSELMNEAKKEGYFLFPFYVRYALKMFDGSYTKISNPIICYPCVRRNCYFFPAGWDEDKREFVENVYFDGNSYHEIHDTAAAYCNMYGAKLKVQAKIENLGNWKDLVKGISIFVSSEVTPFNLEDEWNFSLYSKLVDTKFADPLTKEGVSEEYNFTHPKQGTNKIHSFIVPTYKSDEKIRKDLLSKSQFYKIYDIEDEKYLSGLTVLSISDKMDSGVLETLEQQEQLKTDDYFSWTKKIPTKLFTYNKRLNAIGIRREPFKGFNYFNSTMSISQTADMNVNVSYYTHIVSDTMDAWVKSEPTRFYPTFGWLYYPDPNATEMFIWKEETKKGALIKLKEHPLLNGAYAFDRLPNGTEALDFNKTEEDLPKVEEDAHETFDSQVYTSVVNNPYVFEASGDNTVGTGKIIDIAANTDAVSQGQFGQYPLIVFTSEGIYALSVNSEGMYSASHPISREVCLENSPIVPTDSLVIFVSKKGLMATTGNSVACLSDIMSGKTPKNFVELKDKNFMEFLNGCNIAYDYRDSLLRITRNDVNYQYVYNMVDKTFAIDNVGYKVENIVNNYPDCLIQATGDDTSSNIYTLVGKPNINEDNNTYNGYLITRPLKLGGSISLKSIRALRHLVDTEDGKISLEVYGSNDCYHWQKLTSVGGKPWKYFTFKYSISDFKATDSFIGSVVEIQTRREDKIR